MQPAAQAADADAGGAGGGAASGSSDGDAAPSAPQRHYRGVTFVDGKWVCGIYLNKANAAKEGLPSARHVRLAAFDTEEEAARAYDMKARQLGNFTHFNFPRPGEEQAVPMEVSQATLMAAAASRAQRKADEAAGLPAEARKRKKAAVTEPAAQAAQPQPQVQPQVQPPLAAPAFAAAAAAPPPAAPPPPPPPSAAADAALSAALSRHGLAHLAPRFAAERLDSELLRVAGASVLRSGGALARLGVPDTMGDRLRLALALRDLGVPDALTLAEV